MNLSGTRFWLGTFTGVALLAMLLFPVAAAAVWVLARRRGLRDALAEVAIVYWTLPLVWMTMLPGSHAGVAPGRVSLIPFRDLLSDSAPQIVGNLLLFAVLGFFVPIRFAVGLRRVLAIAACCSVAIEVSQYVFRLDRVSSVDDVLLNTVGAGLAALASYRWWTCRPRMKNRIRARNAVRS
ncbi:glycopeptide antibiotics resistance protein [Kribbella aluminosa]|uniref:Glycopeptide antibiotics resistance protein n=1 Tax=Kribbella aluminosa TaxID=416017 RepID=A0ABS4UNI4_9ACTN|nr:VanZ family protein [Kribbella aluminosa]MBP2353159.1 glycopeptide antibiotics resistance protein [Kribbella aluminosa]